MKTLKKVTKPSKLSDLIDKVSWNKLEPVEKWKKNTCNPGRIKVYFTTHKNGDPINRVVIRIGAEVAEKLGWVKGDTILPLYHIDDQMLFLMVKNDFGKGYLLQAEKKGGFRIVFSWNRDIPLFRMAPTEVEFEISKKQLIFRVNRSDEEG